MNLNKLQCPEGTKDYLPQVAARKRYLEEELLKVFEGWGYQEITTPTFEYYDVLSAGSERLQEKMYKFFNRKGDVLALRPEMTASIARLAATQLKDYPLPLKLSYQSNVFRYETPRAGRHREFYQAGIELLGLDTPLGDAEVIAIATQALIRSGLNNFKIDVGDVDYFTGIMKTANVNQKLQTEIRIALSNKNLVKLKSLLDQTELTSQQKEAIITVQNLRGGLEVIQQARSLVSNQESIAALDNLKAVYQNLELLGVSQYICLDLSVVRSFNYYTGIVFEGYTQDLGYTICGGGRYDGLVEKFGYPVCATGFAVGIDRLLLSLEKQDYKFPLNSINSLLLMDPSNKQEGFKLAAGLRQQGENVEVEIYNRELEQVVEYVQHKGIQRLLIVGEKKKIKEKLEHPTTLRKIAGVEVLSVQLGGRD